MILGGQSPGDPGDYLLGNISDQVSSIFVDKKI